MTSEDLKLSELSAPPAVAGLPLIGPAWQLWRDPLRYLREAHAKHGDIFSVSAANRRFVVLAGRKANKFVATEGRKSLQSRGFWGKFTAERECPHMMLAMDGPDHRSLRKVYHDDLSRRVVDERRGAVAELTREAFSAAAERGEFQALELLRTLVSRQVFELMTYGAAPISAEDAEALREAFRWETNSLLLGKWPRAALRLRSYRKVRARSDSFISALVQQYEADPPAGWFANTFAGRAAHPSLFEDGDVDAAFLLPFVAGVDTVGATLGFLLWELFRSPELQERVRSSVDAAFGDTASFPTISELRGIPDLDGLVRESLRLHPAAFAVYRTAKSDFEYAGYRVAAGTDVLVFTSSTHTDSAYFSDPYAFDIDRFRVPRNEHRKSHVLAPFGGGPHICLGAGMGEAQLLLTAAVVIREFDLDVASPTGPLKPCYDPSYSPPRTLRFRIRPRSKSSS